jgi:pyruvyltransferase
MIYMNYFRKLMKKVLGRKKKKLKNIEREAAIAAGVRLSVAPETEPGYAGPHWMTELRSKYKPSSKLVLVDGRVPLVWWVKSPNFGDLLSPWLVGRMTGRSVLYGKGLPKNYVSTGSILRHVEAGSVVWGTGSFGPEPSTQVCNTAEYLCVRGPLTRSKILDFHGTCPKLYGDPALAAPLFYWPDVKVTHEYGIVIRWSEKRWKELESTEEIKIIDLATGDIDATIKAMLSCRKIASSSLHGLILADAYGIPNAWIEAGKELGGSRPKGGEYKFYDYFISVGKLRAAQLMRIEGHRPDVSHLDFSDSKMEFDYQKFLDACPFLEQNEPSDNVITR